MILKVMPTHRAGEMFDAHFFEVGDEVSHGIHFIDSDPMSEKEEGPYLTDLLGIVADRFHVMDVRPFAERGSATQWPVKFATFRNAEGFNVVVNNGPMYLLSDNGDTIEKF